MGKQRIERRHFERSEGSTCCKEHWGFRNMEISPAIICDNKREFTSRWNANQMQKKRKKKPEEICEHLQNTTEGREFLISRDTYHNINPNGRFRWSTGFIFSLCLPWSTIRNTASCPPHVFALCWPQPPNLQNWIYL